MIFSLHFFIMHLFFLNEFVFGYKFTIISTGDIHGWIDGHKHVPELDMDFGDFYNFVFHMKNKSTDSDSVLYFDTGDLAQGTGLSDCTHPYGSFIFEIFNELPVDVFTLGNHDIHKNECVDNIATHVKPLFGERLIGGNIRHHDSSKKLTDMYKVISIPNFGKVVVLGFIFGDKHNANHSIVKPIANTIKEEEWLVEALSTSDMQLLVVVGHVGIMEPETQVFIDAIRNLKPSIPLLFLGGHRHWMEINIPFNNEVRLQTGAFFNRIAIVQFDLPPSSSSALFYSPSVGFENLNITFPITSVSEIQAYLSLPPSTPFALPKGQLIKARIAAKRKELELDREVGCADVTYDRCFEGSRRGRKGAGKGWGLETGERHDLFELWVDRVLAEMKPAYDKKKSIGPDGKQKGIVYVISLRTFRGNMYKGALVYDDLVTILPWRQAVCVIRNVTAADVHALSALCAHRDAPSETNDEVQSRGQYQGQGQGQGQEQRQKHEPEQGWKTSVDMFKNDGDNCNGDYGDVIDFSEMDDMMENDTEVDDKHIHELVKDNETVGKGKGKKERKRKEKKKIEYYMSNVPNIEEHGYYDVGASSYDVDRIIQTLHALHESPAQPLPSLLPVQLSTLSPPLYVREDTEHIDVEVLEEYVRMYMRCDRQRGKEEEEASGRKEEEKGKGIIKKGRRGSSGKEEKEQEDPREKGQMGEMSLHRHTHDGSYVQPQKTGEEL